MAKTHTLVDNFNDNTTDPGRWIVQAAPGTQVAETNGRLEILPRPHLAGTNGGAYRSTGLFDFSDSTVRVEVVHALAAPTDASTYLSVGPDGSNEIYISIQEGMVRALADANGGSFAYGKVPYDPARHRWLRLRHETAAVAGGDVVYYETSPDGVEWEVLAAPAPPIPVTSLYVYLGARTHAAVPRPGLAVFDNFNVQNTPLARRVEERRLSARDVRVQAAEVAAARRHPEHMNNNDEVNYPTRPLAGNYSKSLKHDAFGDPDPASYATLLRALESRDPADFEEIQLASPTALKLTSPQAGLAFDIAGPDAQALTQPPAPRFDSEVAAHEAGELYWMAVARDVHFSSYGTDPAIAAAVVSLNGEFPQSGATTPVTTQNVFRGVYPGEQVGPYVSQFLLKGNTDPRKPDTLGRDANEGFISYGARVIDQRLIPAAAGVNYLTDFPWWRDVQNGVDKRGLDTFDTARRFIRNLRDGATFVHFDQVVDAFYNAAWILMSEPTGNQFALQAGITGRPQIDAEFLNDPGNPYNPPGTADDSRTQAGFATFGPIHLLQVLSEVLGRALRAVWWQKWGVHRRLRPEEYGGRVHNQVLFNTTSGAQGRSYPLHTSITASLQSGGLAPYYGGQTVSEFPSYLLPQAYPEGAPTHPAYGAGHATGAGACATILKAFFNEATAIENPVQASTDGLSLVAYPLPLAAPLTVGDELNKLAGNIAIFRNAAGVHWRSDYTESLPFGEAIAIGLLQEMSLGFNEDDAFFELTKFDGQRIRIFDGKVVPVVV
jgi:hypothetical protein